jgi:hypothetical protein
MIATDGTPTIASPARRAPRPITAPRREPDWPGYTPEAQAYELATRPADDPCPVCQPIPAGLEGLERRGTNLLDPDDTWTVDDDDPCPVCQPIPAESVGRSKYEPGWTIPYHHNYCDHYATAIGDPNTCGRCGATRLHV